MNPLVPLLAAGFDPTLIKLILGTLAPDSGRLRLGTNLQVAYFDQMREALDNQHLGFQQGVMHRHILGAEHRRHVHGQTGDPTGHALLQESGRREQAVVREGGVVMQV